MSTNPAPALTLACPGCEKKLRVAASAAGRKAKCPACQTVLRIPACQTASRIPPKKPIAAAAAQPATKPAPLIAEPWPETPAPEAPCPVENDLYDFIQSQPSAPAASTLHDFDAEQSPKVRYPAPKKYEPFRREKGWTDKGVLGGLGMMIGAVVWFVVGIALLDRIFFVPPILFVIGLVAFIKGLVTGNIAGEK